MTMYTVAIIAGFFLVLALDRALHTNIIRPTLRLFYTTFTFVIFQLILDNYFTSQGLWVFNARETIGVFVPFIPIENLFFGMEMLWTTLILYSKLNE